MRTAILCLAALCLCAAVPAAEPTAESAGTSPSNQKTSAGTVKPSKPAQATPAKQPTKTEVELSGVTSETADNVLTRLNFSRTTQPRQFVFKSGYGIQKTRTYNAKGKVSKQKINSYNLDAQYRINKGRRYSFLSANANIKDRTPAGADGKSGYRSWSAGIGCKSLLGLDTEVALAAVTTYGRSPDRTVTLVYAARMKHELSDALVLDGDVRTSRPFAQNALVDTHVSLTYRLTDCVGLRLTYVANNMLAPVSSRSNWDKSLRLSLTFNDPAK